MLNQLDFATQRHHAPADAVRIGLLGSTMTSAAYTDYLARLYAFEAPVEARWGRIAGLDRVIELPLRIRTPYLFSDLTALGITPTRLPAPNFAGIEQALGWMYVVERGRRLHGVLYRHVVRRLPREATIAGNYLIASSIRGTRWQELGEALDRVTRDHYIADQILNAALRAFRMLRMTPSSSGARAA